MADEENGQYAFYRYHVADPVFFYRDIRVTMQQIGCWSPENMKQFAEARHQLIVNGPGMVPVDMNDALATKSWGLYERQDDWSSCCYFYLDRPENGLPMLADVSERTGGAAGTGYEAKNDGPNVGWPAIPNSHIQISPLR